MKFVPISNENREKITSFITDQWLTTEMIIRGEVIDMKQVDGIVCYDDSNIIALITYVVYGDVCEIISLDSLIESRGIGTALIKDIITIAQKNMCKKIIVVTTNDNINAIRFYQKRGFDMVKLYHNSLDVSRKLKPEIPLIGENNIPLQHEIEFEYNLNYS